MLIATENKKQDNGHWYTNGGESAHGATLREARKQNLYPSVTTVLQIKAKPGLDAWKRNEAILAALTLPRREGESLEDFAGRVAIDMNETASKAATIGTSIHDWAEHYCGGNPVAPPLGYEAVCYNLQKWIDENLDLNAGASELSIVNQQLGYAGRIDWQGKDKEGNFLILDFKSQGIKEGKKPVFYPEWAYQLAAYAEGKNVRLVNVVISTNKDLPIVESYEWKEEEKETAWKIFRNCLRIWQLEKGYKPE
jgi:hypothetical protein